MSRGISRATDNINLVNKARTELGLDYSENGVCHINQYFIETPVFTFTLPDLSIFPGMLKKRENVFLKLRWYGYPYIYYLLAVCCI